MNYRAALLALVSFCGSASASAASTVYLQAQAYATFTDRYFYRTYRYDPTTGFRVGFDTNPYTFEELGFDNYPGQILPEVGDRYLVDITITQLSSYAFSVSCTTGGAAIAFMCGPVYEPWQDADRLTFSAYPFVFSIGKNGGSTYYDNDAYGDLTTIDGIDWSYEEGWRVKSELEILSITQGPASLVTPVPLPASGLLLATCLALALPRRRSRSASPTRPSRLPAGPRPE